MKVTEIKVYLLEKRLTSSMCISRGGFTIRNHAIVEVHTDEGISGLGEAVGSAQLAKATIDQHLGRLAYGLDPRNIEEVRKKLLDSQVYFERMGSTVCGASAIEMACWDIKAKALGVPLYELLGGLSRDRIEAYASNVYWEEDLSAMARCAEEILEKGIKAVKAHIGFKGPELDRERVRVLREAIGAETKLMIDLNAGYTYTQALKACELWAPYNLYWLEEPLSPFHSERLHELKEHTEIPLALGENEFRTFGFKRLFDLQAVDIAMPDIGRVGGIQETKNVCTLAEAYGVEVSPHNYSSGVLLAATLHLMASTPYSMLLEFDASENAIYQEFFVESLEIRDGVVTIPKQPGLGVTLSKEVMQYQVK
ncbi:MAG: mandelate racemase/muconate lactonizing enzyme family protein [Desulfomonile sp.]